MTRSTLVPEMKWGVAETTEPTEQAIGCSVCLAAGIYEPPTIVFYVNGTSLCRAHTAQVPR